MADLFRTLIITASDADTARAIAAAFGPGGIGMWTTGLSPTGHEPATHYISSGFVPTEFAALAPYARWEQEDAAWVLAEYNIGDPETIHAYISQAGLTLSLYEVEGLAARADISEQEPFVAMDRIGLKIVQEIDK